MGTIDNALTVEDLLVLRRRMIGFVAKRWREDPEDIVQTILLKMFEAIKAEQPINQSYVFRALKWEIVNQIRRPENRGSVIRGEAYDDALSQIAAPSDQAREYEISEEVESYLRRLPERQRVSILMQADGRTAKETGEVLDASVDSVKKLRSRARDRMAQIRNMGREKVEEKSEAPRPYNLSSREMEVLQLLFEGVSRKQIATILIISIHTVKQHVTKIMSKLGVDSITKALVKATREEIVTDRGRP